MNSLKTAMGALLMLGVCSYPLQAWSWTSLTYQEALSQCALGYQYACGVAYQYLQGGSNRSNGGYGGSPADAWVSPQELQQGGVRGSRPGVFSTYDFIR